MEHVRLLGALTTWGRGGAQAAVLRELGAEHVLLSPSTVTMEPEEAQVCQLARVRAFHEEEGLAGPEKPCLCM